MCPYYLDGDLDTKAPRGKPPGVLGSVIPNCFGSSTPRCIRGVMVCCAVLKVREEAFARGSIRVVVRSADRAGARSLKTQQHAGAKRRLRDAGELAPQVRSTFLGDRPGEGRASERCSLERR